MIETWWKTTRPIKAQRADKLTPEQRRELTACSRSFVRFLAHWHIRGEDSQDHVLGESMWGGQARLAEAMVTDPWLIVLKARKLGFSELEMAFDGWCLRFGPEGARVHVLSRVESSAREFLYGIRGSGGIEYGLRNLPEHMRLPVQTRSNDITIEAGPSDIRVVVGYATDEHSSTEFSAVHVSVDEMAKMAAPEKVWRTVEPSVVPGGTMHCLSTGQGPSGWFAEMWGRASAGKGRVKPFFASALERPDRTLESLAEIRKLHGEKAWRNEYPQEPLDALWAGGSAVLDRASLDRCCSGSGPESAEVGHAYRLGFDFGDRQDFSCGVVVDVTKPPFEVVHVEYLRGVGYPRIQRMVKDLWEEYGGKGSKMHAEDNGVGRACLDNVDLPQSVVDRARFVTSKPRKEAALSNLARAFEHGELQYSRKDFPQLDQELRAAQWDSHVPDGVMALSIALHDSQGIRRRDRGHFRGDLARSLNNLQPYSSGGNRHPATPAGWG